MIALAACAAQADAQSWETLTTGVDTNLRGIHAANIPGQREIAIWASGSHGIIFRSTDSGKTWAQVPVNSHPDLDFRGIVAFDDKTAYVLSSGEGAKSNIYKTSDGGSTWDLQYTGAAETIFLDSIACLSPQDCLALGDPVNGKFLLLRTVDGKNWSSLPSRNLPTALPKEGAFAASNSNLLALSPSELYLVTGGFAARVLHTTDTGQHWQTSAVPIAADNATSGIFSLARGKNGELAVSGGDYSSPKSSLRVLAQTKGFANDWHSPQQQPGGYRSAIVFVDEQTLLAVGPTGSDISQDAGSHWLPFPALALNAIFVLDSEHVYAAGTNGFIAKFSAAKTN